MNDSMAVFGKLYGAGSARAEPARLSRLADGGFVVTLDVTVERHDLGALYTTTERVAGSATRIEFADGSAFVTEDADGLDRLIGGRAGGWSRLLARLEQPRFRTLALLGALLLALVVALRVTLPLAADAAVVLVPDVLERRIGAEAFSQLDRYQFAASALAPDRQNALHAQFRLVAEAAGVDPIPALQFRSAPFLGANALALPGGPVVITDELVVVAPSDDALAGVMAHELGHLRERHGLRRIVRSIAVVFLVSTLFGDVGSISDELVTLAGLAVVSAYSREFEREADAAAIDALQRLGIPTKAFAEMLDVLDARCGERCAGGWFRSHPDTEDRIKAAGG